MESPHVPTRPTSTTRPRVAPWHVPLAAALILALGITVWGAMVSPPTALAYGCTSFYGGNCYAYGSWGGANGSRTTMSITNVTCSGCTTSNGWKVIDAMWLGDDSQWAYNNCDYGACWVEVGTWTAAGAENYCGGLPMCYYWADARPCGGGYANHFGWTAAYDIGTNQTSTIQLGQNQGEETCGLFGTNPPDTTWNVSETSSYFGTGLSGPTTSTYNPMKPTKIEIGGELNATSGVTNPTTTWTNNQYWFSGPWGNQTHSGSSGVDAPWSAGWINLTSPNWQATCNCQSS